MRKFLALPLLFLASLSFGASKYQTDYLTATTSATVGSYVTVVAPSVTSSSYTTGSGVEFPYCSGGCFGSPINYALVYAYKNYGDERVYSAEVGIYEYGTTSSDHQMTFNWNEIPGADGYILKAYHVPPFIGTQYFGYVDISTTNYTIGDLSLMNSGSITISPVSPYALNNQVLDVVGTARIQRGLYVVGSATATTYYGDGSNLTGIVPGSQIYPSTDVPSFPYGATASSLTVQDANSNYQIFLGTLPKNGGFGPQLVENGVWSNTNGSYQMIVTTVSRMTTAGGAPYIPADGASLIYSPSSIYYSTYNYLTPTGTQVWRVDSTGFALPSLANNSVIGTDSSGYLVAGTGGISYSSASVSYLGLSTYTATTGTFQKSTMTAESYQTILSSNTTTSINWQSGDAKTQTITASSTYTFTNLPTGTNNKTLNMRVINTGSFKMTWPSTIKWTTGVSGSSPTASGVTIYTFQEFDGTVYGAFIAGFPR